MHEFLATLSTQNLSPQEIETRDRFVEEYFKDYSLKKAAIRIGYPEAMAEECAKLLINDGYVLNRIEERRKAASENPNKEKEEHRRQVINMLMKEAQNYGAGSSHSARVSALSKLATLLDMDPASKLHLTQDKGGVMQVPVMQTADAWEQQASQQQESLTKH